MALVETPQAFLYDMGKAVVFGAYSTLGLLDQPDEEVALGSAVSRQYLLTYETSKLPGLSKGSSLTVAGVSYTVLQSPFALDDGIFSTVRLQAT